MAKSNEPIWWSLFSAGGVIAALLIPAFMLVTGLILPFVDSPDEIALRELAQHPIARLLLFLVISLPLFHWAHRFRFTVADLGLHGAKVLVAVLCYGSAIVGTVVTGYVVCTL